MSAAVPSAEERDQQHAEADLDVERCPGCQSVLCPDCGRPIETIITTGDLL